MKLDRRKSRVPETHSVTAYRLPVDANYRAFNADGTMTGFVTVADQTFSALTEDENTDTIFFALADALLSVL